MQVDQGNQFKSGHESLPFVEKYRPDNLQKIISHDEIVRTIGKFIETKRMPHLLFHGPPGTGKTSCMLAIAKELYGKQFRNMTLELNASDDRGINVVREQIKSFCSTQQLMSKGVKLVILDECDSMTSAAQFALRRIVEKYSKTTRFCLICNYVSKIIPALQSRCTRFRFGPLSNVSVLIKLNEVCNAEELIMEPGAKEAIVGLSGGDMRKVLNILESCCLSYKEISLSKIYEVTGRPSPTDIDTIFNTLTNENFTNAFEIILNMKKQKSQALDDILREVHQRVMQAQLTDQMKMFLISRLAEVEFRLASGVNERAQLASIVGAFIEVRSIKA